MRNKGFHHVAFACRDIQATVKFYEDLMGFPLIHTELGGTPEAYMRHIFFDLGDGSSLAFFDLHGLGEPEEIRTDISTGMGLPVWVNHVAFAADQARYDEVKKKMAEANVEPIMEVDHEWCHSIYYADPNGIMVEFCLDTPGFIPDREKAKSLLTAVPKV
ncbi:MAG: catechol 2,3-dioxygenase-like lactoylglutathione lyase family enzyme [Candidatus Azotimanducaceae bacterium]|jgi:catechol 2,3-dioxygenase-like lactoylglutathione lyase family enzyme